MEIILIIALALLLYVSVICRLIVLHPLATVLYAAKDIFLYFKHHKLSKFAYKSSFTHSDAKIIIF